MTNAELIAKIKAEIDKLYGEYKNKFHQCGDQYHLGLIDGLDMAERVLDTIESEKPMNPDDAMKELDEKIALVKQRGTWDGVDVDEYMDEVRGRAPEKPINQEDELNGEIKKFVAEYGYERSEDILLIAIVARHFAEWGYLRAAEKYNEIEYNRQRAEEDTPKDLEEAAWDCVLDSVDVNNPVLLPKYKVLLTSLFIAGAKWQKEQDEEEQADLFTIVALDAAQRAKEQMMKEAVEGEITKDNRGNNVVRTGAFNNGFEIGDKVRIIIVKED